MRRALLYSIATSVLAAASAAAYATETLSYTYDALGRLIVVQATGTVNNGQAHSVCYDRADNRSRYKSDSGGALATCTPSPTPTPTPTPPPAPSFLIDDPSAMENATMVFIVTRSGSTAGSNSVNWATANGTATSAQDYFAASGTLTFAPGETAKIISVTLRNNTLIEPDEYFYVNLTSPTNGAAISDNQGAGTIIDDDGGGCGGQAC